MDIGHVNPRHTIGIPITVRNVVITGPHQHHRGDAALVTDAGARGSRRRTDRSTRNESAFGRTVAATCPKANGDEP